MDFRLRKLGTLRLVRPSEGLRAMARRAPQAEEFAERWAERLASQRKRLYALRRRIATVAVGTAAALLLVHVVFGANGMVVYQQKHAEVQQLRIKTQKILEENEALTQQNAELGSEKSKAVEREAREHLHYAKPGEFVYVPSDPQSTPPDNHSARK
jgi:cell division protein FtsB